MLINPPVDNKYTAVLPSQGAAGKAFSYRLLCAVGSTVEGLCSQQSDCGMRTATFTNKCEATEWTNSYKSAKTKAVTRERERNTGKPPSSPCFRFNIAETKCFRKSLIHSKSQAQREKALLLTYYIWGESTITFLMRRPGDLWMNPSL